MNTHLLGNEHQWIIETHYNDSEEFDYHWDKKVFPAETREDVSDQTSKYRANRVMCFVDCRVQKRWLAKGAQT